MCWGIPIPAAFQFSLGHPFRRSCRQPGAWSSARSPRQFLDGIFHRFQRARHVALLDWYGATYLTLKTEGLVHDRSATCAKYLGAAVAPLFLGISVESWVVRPDLPGHAIHNPFCWLGSLVAIVSIIMLISGLSTHREVRAFLGSNGLLVGLSATAAGAISPVMLYSTLALENSLTV
jgi:cytochrome bd-type quinol oxidase subunit 2